MTECMIQSRHRSAAAKLDSDKLGNSLSRSSVTVGGRGEGAKFLGRYVFFGGVGGEPKLPYRS